MLLSELLTYFNGTFSVSGLVLVVIFTVLATVL